MKSSGLLTSVLLLAKRLFRSPPVEMPRGQENGKSSVLSETSHRCHIFLTTSDNIFELHHRVNDVEMEMILLDNNRGIHLVLLLLKSVCKPLSSRQGKIPGRPFLPARRCRSQTRQRAL